MAWALILAAWIAGFFPPAAWAWTQLGDASVQDSLGVGTETPLRQVHVRGENAVFRMDRDRDGPAFMLVETALGNFNTIYKTFVVSTIASGVNNGQFVINDLGTAVAGAGTRRLTIATDGLIGNTTAPAAGLHIQNPTGGNILRLDSNTGSAKFFVQNDGDVYALGADLELRLSSTTPGGFVLTGGTSTLLANTTEGSAEESFVALNGGTAIICSPGDGGILRLMDQDLYKTNYVFYNEGLAIRSDSTNADFTISVSNQHSGADLILATTGDQVKFVADSDNNTVQIPAFAWYNNGTAAANRLMELVSNSGQLRIKGVLTQNSGFDLAEAYWKSDAAIESGDVVCIDPEQPNAVVLARAANDRAVIGVASTDPGLIMGGGAFTVENLAELWGDDVAALFAAEQKGVEKSLLASDPYFLGRAAQMDAMKSAMAKNARSKDAAAAKGGYDSEAQQLAGDLESAALEAFCRENLALVAMAGRVPVKVVAAGGAIRVGDLLVASATPGKAMSADHPAPGTVIGKALESFDAGDGTIMMMVLNR
ncbi:MAG: hypothetical protein AB7V22_11745 [Kiritimatiellia bacterium]